MSSGDREQGDPVFNKGCAGGVSEIVETLQEEGRSGIVLEIRVGIQFQQRLAGGVSEIV